GHMMTLSSGTYDERRAGVAAFRSPDDRGARERARAASRGAHRVLLPDARVAVRGRGCSPGDAASRLARLRPVQGTGCAALVALPDRDERMSGHAHRPRAAHAPDGPWAGARSAGRQPGDLARGAV